MLLFRLLSQIVGGHVCHVASVASVASIIWGWAPPPARPPAPPGSPGPSLSPCRGTWVHVTMNSRASRRFHNHRKGRKFWMLHVHYDFCAGVSISRLLIVFRWPFSIVDTFNQEQALLGAFFVIVKYSRTFIWSWSYAIFDTEDTSL